MPWVSLLPAPAGVGVGEKRDPGNDVETVQEKPLSPRVTRLLQSAAAVRVYEPLPLTFYHV